MVRELNQACKLVRSVVGKVKEAVLHVMKKKCGRMSVRVSVVPARYLEKLPGKVNTHPFPIDL